MGAFRTAFHADAESADEAGRRAHQRRISGVGSGGGGWRGLRKEISIEPNQSTETTTMGTEPTEPSTSLNLNLTRGHCNSGSGVRTAETQKWPQSGPPKLLGVCVCVCVRVCVCGLRGRRGYGVVVVVVAWWWWWRH